MPLFQGESLSTFLETNVQSAARTIEALTLAELNDPGLAGQIEKIWASLRPAIPVLKRNEKEGTMREVKFTRENYGREITGQETVVDVKVPFHGAGRMFQIRPSTMSLLNVQVEARDGCLHYTMPLGAEHEPRFEKMLDQVEQTLATQRAEVEQFSKHAIQMLTRLAETRAQKLSDQSKVAGGMSFPIKSGTR